MVARLLLNVTLAVLVLTTVSASTSWETVQCTSDEVPFGTGSSKTCRSLSDAYTSAMDFLRKNMPAFDVPNEDTLFDSGIADLGVNVTLSTKQKLPWAQELDEEIFNNFVLPYAHVNEGRNNWRPLLHDKLVSLVYNDTFVASSFEQVATMINDNMWRILGQNGKAIHFQGEQTPLIYDPMSTIVYGYASCTGVSILYADALRAVGVPARIVGTPAWNADVSHGNHNWVEVYLGTQAYGNADGWYFIEASPAGPGESFSNPCDKWFCNPGHFAEKPATRVYAPQWAGAASATYYPMAWDLENKQIPGIDRTDYYLSACGAC